MQVWDPQKALQRPHMASIMVIVAKALDGQRYPLPLCEYMKVCDGERGSGPEGADDLCLVNFEALGLNLSRFGTLWRWRCRGKGVNPSIAKLSHDSGGRHTEMSRLQSDLI